jgi:hypothetical protein
LTKGIEYEIMDLRRERFMKKLVNVTEVEGEGLVSLLGENVLVFCMNYIYTGLLSGVNTNDILLENARIVYETGAFGDNSFKDAQVIGHDLYIRTSSIESYSKTSKK